MKTTMKMIRAAMVIAAFSGLSACASGGAGAGGEGRGAGDILTNEDLVATNEANVYQAVQRLRPRWLRTRGSTSLNTATTVTLFVDGSPRGGVANLGSIRIQEVAEVEYLSASDAAFRFGTLAGSGGTIAVTTRR